MDIKEINSSNKFRHPWEISRATNILSLINRSMTTGDIADIGAGDLYFAGLLKSLTGRNISAVDHAYKSFKPENPSVLQLYEDIGQLHKDQFGAVFLLDVLEHNNNEAEFLGKISELLKTNGKLIVTVPAFQFLFSEHDRFLDHKRRYSKHQLKDILLKSGYETEETFYFFFALFAVRIIELLTINFAGKPLIKHSIGSWKYAASSVITKIILFTLNIDFIICRTFSKLNIFIPGLSLCAICKKK